LDSPCQWLDLFHRCPCLNKYVQAHGRETTCPDQYAKHCKQISFLAAHASKNRRSPSTPKKETGLVRDAGYYLTRSTNQLMRCNYALRRMRWPVFEGAHFASVLHDTGYLQIASSVRLYPLRRLMFHSSHEGGGGGNMHNTNTSGLF
jgi:hypothetical protein